MDAAVLNRRFVGAQEKVAFRSAFAWEEWLCRPDIAPAKELLLVRATIEPGGAHAFHTHPTREEIIYVLSGRAEQWVGAQRRELGAGDMALIPRGEVHGTYNVGAEPLTFLAILSPAHAEGPATVDVASEEPWCSLRPPGSSQAQSQPVCP
jgi:quercetin dioxygenase-like cupin family protein